MRIVTISGVRGSGKTTLIRELIVRFGEKGRRSSVILNEEGEETYAQDFLEAHGVEVFPLWGG
jgi:molybdopterin-guanine dinucleotide biosynthesis protein